MICKHIHEYCNICILQNSLVKKVRSISNRGRNIDQLCYLGITSTCDTQGYQIWSHTSEIVCEMLHKITDPFFSLSLTMSSTLYMLCSSMLVLPALPVQATSKIEELWFGLLAPILAQSCTCVEVEPSLAFATRPTSKHQTIMWSGL